MSVSHPDLVVLGLLADGPQHGYELRKQIESMRLRRWARIGDSTVYAALQRLEAKGLLSRRTRAGGKRPDRQVYRITRRGRQHLDELIVAALESPEPAYSDRLVGAVFAAARTGGHDEAAGTTEKHPADRDAPLEALQQAAARLAEAERHLGRLQEEDQLSPFGRVVVRFNREVVAAERRALEQILEISAQIPSRPSLPSES